MKTILVAAASLISAGAAFGFAKAIDGPVVVPEIAAPNYFLSVQRATSKDTADYPLSTRRIDAARIGPGQMTKDSAKPAQIDDKAARVAAYIETITPQISGHHGSGRTTTPPSPDIAGQPVRQYRFSDVAIIGVYR